MDKFTPEEQKEIVKDAMKEALKEWLDKQFAAFGRWTFYGILSAGLALFAWVYLHINTLKVG